MRRWLAGAVLVSIGWLASPQAVPIYDGIGTDNPYRYVGKSPAPTTATQTVKVGSTGASGVELQTGETGPQLIINAAAGTLRASTPELQITATPLLADGPVPRGTLDGNAYRITVTPAATTFDPTASSGFVFLRAAVMTGAPYPVIVHRATATDPWQEVPTTKSGRDVLGTAFTALGDYAVVRLPGAKPLSQSGGLSPTRLVFLGGGVLLLVVITVLVLRRPREDED